MEKSLERTRGEWEKLLTPKCTLDLGGRTVVILENEKTNTYYIHRYFLLGGEWACSIDKDGISLNEVFENLEWQV